VNRERNHTHLTELGEIMRPQLEQVHDQVINAKQRARSMRDLRDGSLRIGIMNSTVTRQTIGVIDRFRRAHGGMDLQFIAAGPGNVRERLTEGGVDAAIYSSPEVDPPDFHALELFRERFTVAVGPGHRFAMLDEVRLSDLAGERYLVRAHGEHEPQFDQLLADHAVGLGGRYRSDRDDWIDAMTAAGFGFCFLPEGALSSDNLVIRRLVDPELERVVSLLTMRGRPHSPALVAFLENVRRNRQVEQVDLGRANGAEHPQRAEARV
jgi:DNA-binding transcriptional LysR family regulator